MSPAGPVLVAPPLPLRAVPGSIAFYAAFYVGTLLYLAIAFAALAFGERVFLRVSLSWSRFHLACLRTTVGIRVEVSGPVPPPEALIAFKHESFFEALHLPSLLDNPAIFAKAELLRIPLWGPIAAAYGLIPIERNQGARALRAMLKAARERIGQRRRLVIFPEGTRVPHGDAPPLKSGFAGLYRMLGVPVVPVAVDSGPLYQPLWKRAGTIHIRFAEPIPPGLAREEIETRVHAAINALNR